MGKKTVETTASGLNQFIGKQGLSPLDTEEVTELGQYFPSSGGGSGFEPTEAQLDAMNSGITAAKVAAYDTLPDENDVKDIVSDHFVAGTNVTITDNVDGTQTIASTASGGFTPNTDQLAAMNSGITSEWVTNFKDVYSNCLPERVWSNLAYDGAGQTGYVHEATGDYINIPGLSTQAVLQRIYTKSNYIEYAWDVNGNHAVRYSSGDIYYNPTWSNWIVIPASSAPTPPTAYTETLTGRSWKIGSSSYKSVVSDGGFVVVDNICTFNIHITFTFTGSNSVDIPGDKKIIYGFPAPCNTGPVPKFIGRDEQSTPVTFRCSIDTSGDLLVEYTSSSFKADGFYLTGSYLINTST